MGFLFGSKPEGRHKPTIRERAAASLEKITVFQNKRLEEGRAESERNNKEWHEKDLRDRHHDSGRHSDYGESSGYQDDGEDRRQMLEAERERERQVEQDRSDEQQRLQEQREDERLQRQIDRER